MWLVAAGSDALLRLGPEPRVVKTLSCVPTPVWHRRVQPPHAFLTGEGALSVTASASAPDCWVARKKWSASSAKARGSVMDVLASAV